MNPACATVSMSTPVDRLSAMAEFTDEELSQALDEALSLNASDVVWLIVDEMQRRDNAAEL